MSFAVANSLFENEKKRWREEERNAQDREGAERKGEEGGREGPTKPVTPKVLK